MSLISTQSLVKHLLIEPSAPLIELSFQHHFNFCSSCPLIPSQMRGCCRRKQQSQSAVLSLPSARSASTFPQLMKSLLCSLADPPIRFLLELSPAREENHDVAQPFSWPPVKVSIFLYLLNCVLSLAWITQLIDWQR